MSNELSNKDIINEQEKKIQELNETISKLREELAEKDNEILTWKVKAETNAQLVDYNRKKADELLEALKSISTTIKLATR